MGTGSKHVPMDLITVGKTALLTEVGGKIQEMCVRKSKRENDSGARRFWHALQGEV